MVGTVILVDTTVTLLILSDLILFKYRRALDSRDLVQK